jgi:hypothetical protein
MLTIIKRIVMWLYCREIISAATVVRLFKRLKLRNL